jgi:hypothetical protein
MTDETTQSAQDYATFDAVQLAAVEAQTKLNLKELSIAIAPLQAQQLHLHQQMTAIRNEIDTRKVAAQPESAAAIDWKWLMQEAQDDTAVRYAYANEAIATLTTDSKYRSAPGITFAGYNVHTNQRVLQVALIKGLSSLTLKVQTALQLLLPLVEPCQIGTLGNCFGKYVKIRESSLSANGSYYLLIDEGRGEFKLYCKHYGQVELLYSGKDLTDLLSQVEDKYYAECAKPARRA